MLGTTFKIFVLYAVFSFSLGFMFDDPCNVFPQYSGGIPDSDKFTTTVAVPDNCMNGTFRWDYPRGHTMLEFHNTRVITGICIRDSLGGTVFNITDMTSGQRLGHFARNEWACFESTSVDMTLKVDAPETLRYMGAIDYKITYN